MSHLCPERFYSTEVAGVLHCLVEVSHLHVQLGPLAEQPA